jgi:hypothetical protein
MLFAPKPLGNIVLKRDILEEDRRKCLKIGPCGIGKKAVYLNSFYIDRCYYVTYTDIRRCFKRVAMSKGGYSGKGTFGSMAYLVVQMSDGTEKQCNFKFEDQVDQFLRVIAEDHPEIPTHSAAAEKKLAEAEKAEREKYVQTLDPEAERSVECLRSAEDYLDENPNLSRQLAYAARQKRTIDRINPTYQIFAGIIVIAAIAAVIFGIWAMLNHKGWAVYFVLFGFAFIFLISATRILPTAGRNRKSAQRDWDQALSEMRAFVAGDPEFPIPAQYAHPIVLERMIRAIRMGRARTVAEAMDVVKADLKALNSQVKVSQKEYDEVVVVKPLFLVMNYE